jgi:high affinity sulfate transporter 1
MPLQASAGAFEASRTTLPFAIGLWTKRNLTVWFLWSIEQALAERAAGKVCVSIGDPQHFDIKWRAIPVADLMKLPLPVLTWLSGYDKSWLRGDLVAGITLAAYLIPSALGDASLANLPPEAGLYACLFGGLVFWLFCSSRRTAISVTSAISLLIGASLGEIAGGDTSRFGAFAAATAMLVAAIAFGSWLAKAGAIVNFISESVMTGFKCGVAFFLASTQLPKLFGFHGAHGSFWHNSGHFLKHLNETNSSSLIIGCISLAVLILGKVFLKKKPVALFVVIGGILASSALSLETRGVNLLGEVPQGLPTIGLPSIRWSELNQLLPLAFACFLLGAVETAAIGRMFSAKHGGRFDANQEFLALAAANLAAGLGRGFPVSGGMSQSVVNEGGGARTPLSTALAAGLVLIVVLFFSHFLRSLPQPVLAAVVIVAVAGLFQGSELKHLWHASRSEFTVAIAAFLGVLTSGLLRGVLIGAFISLVQLLRAASRPHVAILGRIPGTRRFSDHERHPDNELIPDLLIFRPESGLVYFNVDHVCETVLDRVRAQPAPPKLVVLDLSAGARVDLQSAHTLAGLADELTAKGIQVKVVETRSSVRERLRGEGLATRLGGIDRFTSVADIVDGLQKDTSPKPGAEAS